MFDFRHGRSTRRLLSDRKRDNWQAVGEGYSKGTFSLLTDFDEKCQGTDDGDECQMVTADSCKPSMKKLIEEEMSNEEEVKKQMTSDEVEPKQSDPEKGDPIRKNRRRINKSKKTCNVHIHNNAGSGNLSKYNSEQQFMSSLDLDAIMEELCGQIHQKSSTCGRHDHHGEHNMQQDKRCPASEEKLSEATKVFISQKFATGTAEDGKTENSQEFTDALQTLNSNKELFLKLLQDPNSLLMKHIQNLLDSQVEKDENSMSHENSNSHKYSKSLPGSNLPDRELLNLKQSKEFTNHKQHKFFRRRSKSQDSISLNGNENYQASNKIVILKPGPVDSRNSETDNGFGSLMQSHNDMTNTGPSERTVSHFSLNEIKRRLKHAMGRERQGTAHNGVLHRFPSNHPSSEDGNKRVSGENIGMHSPNRSHFYTERIPKPSAGSKRGDKIGKLKDCERSMEHDTLGYPNQRVSTIYSEAKKHLSEMLSNGDEDEDILIRQAPRTLGRILSLPEYNLSPICSPGRDWGNNFVTAQMRFSACGKFQRVDENTGRLKQENNVGHSTPLAQNFKNRTYPSNENQDDEAQGSNSSPNISVEVVHDNKVKEACSTRDEISSEGDVEIVKTIDTLLEENRVLDISSESSRSSVIKDDQMECITAESCDEKGFIESLKSDSVEEDQRQSSPLASPSSSLMDKGVVDLASVMDRIERPSPISVLEPLFTEDDISPASIKSKPVEQLMQPLRIQFEEQDASAAHLVTHIKIGVESKDSVFEYIKAVLQISASSLDEFFLMSLTSDQILDPSLLDEEEISSFQLCHDQKLLFNCINEVLMEVCERYFGCFSWASIVKANIRPVPNMKNTIREVWEGVHWHLLPQPLPHNLDQIVRKDMVKTGTWMDLRFEAQIIGIEMSEVVLQELVEDTILCCINESSENVFTMPQADLEEDESSVNLSNTTSC